MKNAKLLSCILMMIIGSAQLMSQNQTISLSKLNNSIIQDFINGNRSDLIVECAEGTSLPFTLGLGGEFLSFEPAAIPSLYLKVMKTCYIRCLSEENFLFSTDLQTWKGFSDFFTGELKLSVEMENGLPVAGLQCELNQSQN